VKVNSELIRFYWELGKDIAEKYLKAYSGSAFFERLSKDLKTALGGTGFSETNLRYFVSFYRMYSDNVKNPPQVVEDLCSLPWGHHRCILDRCKTFDEAFFFVKESLKNGWSRSMLLNFLDTDYYRRQGKALNNFKTQLPENESDLAQEMTKDPYSFEFLSLSPRYHEKELKDALLANIEKFLLELGRGFAYVGREYRLSIGEDDYYIDLLFYNLNLRSYVVVEVKTGKMEPEAVGQLGLYVQAVDETLKKSWDNKSIGILICKTKNEVLARYALKMVNAPIGISDYQLTPLVPESLQSDLPSVEDLEKELNKK
jgi:predicted nuclease of restriction endonuclease-like (RecB) superfamily